MRRSCLFALLSALPLAAGAAVHEGVLVDPAYLTTIRDDSPTPPRSATPLERLQPLPQPKMVPDAPPTGAVRAQAEYEVNDGLLVRWGQQNSLLTEMAVAVTTLTPDARMYVVVTGASQQSSATTTLSGAGANMSRIEFITQACTGADTGCNVWMRDYGPRFIDNDGVRAAVDHVYNRPGRNGDDRFPIVWEAFSGEPRYEMPITHGGGNFHLFSTRAAFMTQLIQNENPSLNAQQIRDMYLQPAFPTSFDATQHIDMWVLPVDDDEVIVSEYPSSVGTPHTIANNFASSRAGEGYTVYRTPGWSSFGDHFTYANSVVINNLVLVCRFNNSQTPSGTGAENTTAANIYAAAFQDKTIVQVNCANIIGLAGAIHCIVMHVPRGDRMFLNGFE
jgi:agmatine/peptidylarginine deiminase